MVVTSAAASGCSVGVSESLCRVCAAPNNLVSAAEKSRKEMLERQEKKSLILVSIIIATFIVCWMPAFTVYQVRIYVL